jgi:hypothetical protein
MIQAGSLRLRRDQESNGVLNHKSSGADPSLSAESFPAGVRDIHGFGSGWHVGVPASSLDVDVWDRRLAKTTRCHTEVYPSAASISFGLALSPNVSLTWTKRSLSPGANTKLPPSCMGSLPSLCCLCPAAWARRRACVFSRRRRWSREARLRPTAL